MSKDLSAIPNPEYENFLRILQANKRRIFGYIFACVPHYCTAEDIMQDTVIRLWSKFSTYTPGTNFAAWGIAYARYVIMEYQLKNRNACVQFDSQALENLSASFETDHECDHRIEALRGCLKKLSEIQGQIIRMRYAQNMTVKDIAMKLSRPIHGMYKTVLKIHYNLQECIEGKLKAEDAI
jgi:RNA polymerase sigma-70 factor, ECF subfamily